MVKLKRLFSSVKGTIAPVFLNDKAPKSPGSILENQALKRPDQPLFLFEERVVTYKEANKTANQYANLFSSLGYKKGDTIALIMENRPEYLMIHTGLSKVGIIPALINTNNRGRVLAHSIKTADARAIICGHELIAHCMDISDEISDLLKKSIYIEKEGKFLESPPNAHDLKPLLEKQSEKNPEPASPIKAGDTLEYIYTSGTTGMPKATILKHKKWLQLGYAVGGMCMASVPGDVQYLCLPLYHNSGINIAWPLTLMWGGTMAIRKKFSASAFWDDIRRYNASHLIYIGELCRYLNNMPEKKNDADNPLRFILGNGMRAEYWEAFRQRFAIEKIIEVYGATEGVGGLINKKGIPGMIGSLTVAGIVKMGEVAQYDKDTGKLILNEKGFAIKCTEGETGMFLPKIGRFNQFSGYRNNKKATGAKLMDNVFKKGDRYFISGDLLKVHSKGYVSFVDRLGDTFKWKGEVVATNEVADIIFRFGGIEDANVYGVEVKGAEGRTGMAALTLLPERTFDLEAFAGYINQNLAVYALPRMIRLREKADTTSTFKQLKTKLKEDGFNPDIIDDPLFFLDPDTKKYVKMSPELFEKIHSGVIRF